MLRGLRGPNLVPVPVPVLYRTAGSVICLGALKGQSREVFDIRFFHQTASLGPIIQKVPTPDGFRFFKIFLEIGTRYHLFKFECGLF